MDNLKWGFKVEKITIHPVRTFDSGSKRFDAEVFNQIRVLNNLATVNAKKKDSRTRYRGQFSR